MKTKTKKVNGQYLMFGRDLSWKVFCQFLPTIYLTIPIRIISCPLKYLNLLNWQLDLLQVTSKFWPNSGIAKVQRAFPLNCFEVLFLYMGRNGHETVPDLNPITYKCIDYSQFKDYSQFRDYCQFRDYSQFVCSYGLLSFSTDLFPFC